MTKEGKKATKRGICCLIFAILCLGLSLSFAATEKMEYKPMPEPTPPAEMVSQPGAIVLKAMTFLPVKHTSNSGFYWFIETISKKANGELVIKFLGGSEVMPPLKQTQLIRQGDFDLSLLPPSYYEKEVPEVVAFALTRNMPWDQRMNGFYLLKIRLMNKLNVRFLRRTASPGNSYSIHTNKAGGTKMEKVWLQMKRGVVRMSVHA